MVLCYDHINNFQVQDDIGASPVEIAKAYMGSRTFEAGSSSKSKVHSIERSFLHDNEDAIKPYVPSLTPKTPVCWPGAVVQDSFTTPQSQSKGFGLHNFPRTPYSRTIFSKSKSRVHLSKNLSIYCDALKIFSLMIFCLFVQSIHMQGSNSQMSATPLHQSQTNLYLLVFFRFTDYFLNFI